jgi:hypothetical protein
MNWMCTDVWQCRSISPHGKGRSSAGLYADTLLPGVLGEVRCRGPRGRFNTLVLFWGREPVDCSGDNPCTSGCDSSVDSFLWCPFLWPRDASSPSSRVEGRYSTVLLAGRTWFEAREMGRYRKRHQRHPTCTCDESLPLIFPHDQENVSDDAKINVR